MKDEEGELRPLAGLWPAEDRGAIKAKYYTEEIEKFMKRGSKSGLKIVKVEIKEIQ